MPTAPKPPRPTVLEIDTATGEHLERPMTDEEYAVWEAGSAPSA